MNARVQRLRADIVGDRQALAKQLDVLRRNDPDEHSDDASLALVAWCLHHAYCALESILERTARVLEGAFREIPSVRMAVLDRMLAPLLHDLRGFRHVVRHAYDSPLEARALGRPGGALWLRKTRSPRISKRSTPGLMRSLRA